MIDFITSQLKQLKGEPLWSCSGPTFNFFASEWNSHLHGDNKKQSLLKLKDQWKQNPSDNLKETLITSKSPTLFSLGESQDWETFHTLLEQSDNNQSLQICQKITQWLSPLAQDPSITFLPEERWNGYDRKILSVLPYSKGVAVTVLFRFPAFFNTPAHRHPQFVSEKILRGKLYEISLKENEDTSFDVIDVQKFQTGDSINGNAIDGFPHIVATTEEEAIGLATFTGTTPMTVIPFQNFQKLHEKTCHIPRFNPAVHP